MFSLKPKNKNNNQTANQPVNNFNTKQNNK